MVKWPNHLISGKQFQKRANGNTRSLQIEFYRFCHGFRLMKQVAYFLVHVYHF
jgi:hypothetical protein